MDDLSDEVIELLLRRALREDLGEGDVTTLCAVPEGARATARLVAKSHGRIAGLEIFAQVFRVLDPGVSWKPEAKDGDPCEPKQVMGVLAGEARALLSGERTALNLVQRMSGIATTTARFVEAAGSLRVLDTRKTNPGLRPFDKYAVRAGGGESHRYGLFDEAMVKNNHVDLAGRPLEQVVRDLREHGGPSLVITSEARDEAEAEAGVRGGADIVLLDNMTPERIAALAPQLRALAETRGRAVELEASGGISHATIESFISCGVDRVSIGALTHSAPSLDLSLYLSPLDPSRPGVSRES